MFILKMYFRPEDVYPKEVYPFILKMFILKMYFRPEDVYPKDPGEMRAD